VQSQLPLNVKRGSEGGKKGRVVRREEGKGKKGVIENSRYTRRKGR